MTPGESQIAICPGCAAALPARELRLHVCDWWRWLDHQVRIRQEELESFERALGSYLESPRGRFDLWYAEHERLRRCPGPPTPASGIGEEP